MKRLHNTVKLYNKNANTRKLSIGYILCVLFLLCYFFSFSPENRVNPLQSEREASCINVMVPQGTLIEIKGESSSSETLFFKQESKTSQSHIFNTLFTLILCLVLLREESFLYLKNQKDTYSYKIHFIIEYIHSLDGKK